MKLFTGFIGEIILGEIIREEIYGIAKSAGHAIYRILYYTKYYQLDELRDRLLNPDKYPEEKKEEEKNKKDKDDKEKLDKEEEEKN